MGGGMCRRLHEPSGIGMSFEKSARNRISQGRFQNVSEVVGASLSILKDCEMTRQKRVQSLKAKINDAWDDPRPSRPADEAFGRIEKLHAEAVERSSTTRV